ncbi:MAG: DUF169 domain-containing protein [Chloroflexota bacterium]
MTSKIDESINFRYSPIAILFSDEKPSDALQFKEGGWGCAIAMFMAAAKGKTAAFDRNTYGCIGGGSGLGFGNTYTKFPGGIEYFLSTGNNEYCASDVGKGLVRNMPALSQGEAYKKTPEMAKTFADELPYTQIPTEYIVFKPLELVEEYERPEVVVFLATPDQISALVVLANYGRNGGENVFTPWGAGCHTIFLFPYNERNSEHPRAVIGLFDISARDKVDKDLLSFAVPYKMYEEMEGNVEESFLMRDVWMKVRNRNI